MTRIAMLSDLHLAPPGPLVSFHAGEALASLLSRLRSDHAADTLVLAGDVFDFLAVPGASGVMHPAEVPSFVDKVFRDLRETDWGKSVFNAIGALGRAGTQISILPGNHDPELAHPEVLALLRAHCGLAVDDRRLVVELGPGPWRTMAGQLEVVIGHGHRGDPWNDIDPAQVLHHATTNPPLPLQLPLGSQLVVGAMRAFRERYAFVDALKPEPAVSLLLLYLDAALARAHLFDTGLLKVRAVMAGLQRRLTGGPTLAGSRAPGVQGSLTPTTASVQITPGNASDDVAATLFESLSSDERNEETFAAIDALLRGHSEAPAAGTLAPHRGPLRYLLRAAIRALGSNGTFFDQTQLDAADLAIVDEHLPPGVGPRVVLAGHTHAARHVTLDAQRTYLNTGTWTDLIPWRPLLNDGEARAFLDDLEHGKVTARPRLTWSLVDERGAQLCEEPARPRTTREVSGLFANEP